MRAQTERSLSRRSLIAAGLQSALVRTRKVKMHKMLGWFGLALGSAIPVVGIATALVMIRMEVRQGLTFVAPFFTISVQDMISFGVTFGLAFWWRTKPEFDRRLMFVATCALTSAAFARIPWVPGRWFYAGVDCLILLGVVRDLVSPQAEGLSYRTSGTGRDINR